MEMSTTRPVVETEDEARRELMTRTKPPWLESDHALPFGNLSDDEFEVLCFLLLRREHRRARVYYFGKTGDSGRDIVIHHEDGTVEVVQCKRYANSVGIGPVRQELAKLHLNGLAGRLGVEPDQVTFYVASDLSAPAIDLITSRVDWQTQLEQGARELLKVDPPAEFVSRLSEFTAELDHVTGLELSERVRKHSDLVEEFFAYKKVITGDAGDLVRKIETMRDELILALSPTGAAASSALQSLLARMEQSNPGLSFAAETTAGHTTLSVRPTSGGAPVEVGQLRFAVGPAGDGAREKIRLLIEEGREAVLDEHEASWVSSIKDAPQLDGAQRRLRFAPHLPPREIAVRMETIGAQESVAIEYTSLRLVRIGTKEVEFNVSGGRWPGSIGFTLRQDVNHGAVTIDTDFSSQPIPRVRTCLQFLHAVATGASVRVSSLEHEAALFEVGGLSSPLDADALRAGVGLCDDLATLNSRLGLRLQYPRKYSTEVARTIRLIAAGITYGTVAEPTDGKPVTLHLPKKHLGPLLDDIDRGPTTVSSENLLRYELEGASIDAGPAELHLEGVLPVRPVDELRAELAQLGDDEIIEVEMRCDRLIHVFRRWVPGAAEPAP